MNGVLPLRKPKGMTSHDCVNRVRKIFQTKKVGHTGTLDPEVEGVLPICIGEATKLVELLMNDTKGYVGEATFGFSTTTEDAHGEIVETKKVKETITNEEIDKRLESFVGEIDQIPPMYSAVKINGKKLYEYAREGKIIERPARKITIHSLERTTETINEDGLVRFSFDVTCSKGTYIRTLAVDIGKSFGYPAHMSHLVRTKSGAITIDKTVTFEELEEAKKNDELQNHLLPIEEIIGFLPKFYPNDEILTKVKNGVVLPKEVFPTNDDRFVLYTKENKAVAVYENHPTKNGLMKLTRMFHNF